MRKTVLSALALSTLALGGCASYGGYGDDPLGDLLGGIFSGGNSNQNLSRFERAAAEACAREAQRYGRVQLTEVRQDDRDIVLVYGRIDTRDTRADEFFCAYRSDGRIVEFDRR